MCEGGSVRPGPEAQQGSLRTGQLRGMAPQGRQLLENVRVNCSAADLELFG